MFPKRPILSPEQPACRQAGIAKEAKSAVREATDGVPNVAEGMSHCPRATCYMYFLALTPGAKSGKLL